jgi:hypothetical protein
VTGVEEKLGFSELSLTKTGVFLEQVCNNSAQHLGPKLEKALSFNTLNIRSTTIPFRMYI